MLTIEDVVAGFNHPTLAETPGYAEFRRALAALADATDAPLQRFLADVRDAAVTSLCGAPCPTCSETCWPFRANRRGQRLRGLYQCETCSSTFQATTDLEDVTWTPQLPRDGDGTRRAHAEGAGQAIGSIPTNLHGGHTR